MIIGLRAGRKVCWLVTLGVRVALWHSVVSNERSEVIELKWEWTFMFSSVKVKRTPSRGTITLSEFRQLNRKAIRREKWEWS